MRVVGGRLAQAALALVGDDEPEQLYKLRREEADRLQQDSEVEEATGQQQNQTEELDTTGVDEINEKDGREPSVGTFKTVPKLIEGQHQNQPGGLGATRVVGFGEKDGREPSVGTFKTVPKLIGGQHQNQPGGLGATGVEGF